MHKEDVDVNAVILPFHDLHSVPTMSSASPCLGVFASSSSPSQSDLPR